MNSNKKVRTREEGGQTCEWSAGPYAWSRPSLRSVLPRRKMNHPQDRVKDRVSLLEVYV